MVETTPRKKDWADDDSSDDDGEELRRQFGSPAKVQTQKDDEPVSAPKDDAPVASLLSRIGGLSTESPDPPSSSAPSSSTPAPPSTRPKPNTANNLFGKALAGATASRKSPSTTTTVPSATAPDFTPTAPTATATPPTGSQTERGKELIPEEKKDKMVRNILDDDDDGWGAPAPINNTTSKDTGGWGDKAPAPPINGQNGMGVSSPRKQAGGDDGRGGPAQSSDDHDAGSKADNGDFEGEGARGLISNDFQVEVKLADMQANPDHPLYSVKTFEELPLHDDLKKGIYAAGFKKPSKIQERALPMLLMNPPRNLIGQSQSGTGKTAAFTLNMLSRVDPGLMTPQAICVAPSRELARQIQEVIDKIGQFTQITTMLAVPGSWSRNQRIEKHILIGTPGTLVDMLSRGNRIFDPKAIRVFVLDEADEMIGLQGLGDQTSRIKRMLPPSVQNVLFSATFPDEVRTFAEQFAPEANEIFLKKEEVTVEAIKQLWLECDGEDQKYDVLSILYDVMSIGQSIVFCKRKDTADRIAARLIEEGHSVAALHGDKDFQARDAVLDGFRNGKTKVLITTNVVARGIDIQQVNMVVNYDVPVMGPDEGYRIDIESYIHRIGRTGRFGRKGCSIIFAHDNRSKDEVHEIMRLLGKPIKRIDARSSTDMEDLEKALKAAMKGPN